MQTIYQINADDLNEDFLEGLKTTFRHKDIEIVVYERDETGYLLQSPRTAPDCSKPSPTLSRVATSSYRTKNSFNENRRFSYISV